MPSSSNIASSRLSSNWTPLREKQKALLFAIFLLGLFLRWYGIGDYPAPSSADEEARNVQNNSWSSVWRDCSIDHPPLLPLMLGAIGPHRKAPSPVAPSPEETIAATRPITLLWFAATFFLLFQFARHAFSPAVGMLAVALYAVLIQNLIQNRLLVAENVTTPLFLLNLYLLQRYDAGRCSRRSFACITMLATAAAMLCRFGAIGQGAAFALTTLLCGRRREAIYPMLGILAAILVYALHAWLQGGFVLPAPAGIESVLPSQIHLLTALVTDPCRQWRLSLNYPMFAGWLALFALAFTSRKRTVFLAPIVYLLLLLPFARAIQGLSWISLPFFPFLCMALAALVSEAWQRASPLVFAGVVVLMLPNAFNIVFEETGRHAALLRPAYLLTVPLLLLLPSLPAGLGRHLRRTVLSALVALMLASQCWALWSLQ